MAMIDCQCSTALITAAVGVPLFLYLARRFFQGGVCYSTARLDGKTAVITGANTGIGLETAKDLSKRGARVILACRSVEKGKAATKEVKQFSRSDNVVFRTLDLASLQSVRDFAKQIIKEEKRLDILINNAGVMWCPYAKTKDGFEMQFGTNHLGHFLLTMLLLDLLKASTPSRIVNVSSSGHRGARHGINFDDINSEKSYSKYYAYFQSKLANVLFTREFSRRLEGSGVTAYSLHPGAVKTELSRHVEESWYRPVVMLAKPMISPMLKTAKQGAQTSIYCAVTEGLEVHSGKYFSDCGLTKTSKHGTDDEAAKKLWQVSVQMVGL